MTRIGDLFDIRGVLATSILMAVASVAAASPAAGTSLAVRWNEGAADCAATPQPPLQVHRYDERTFILRQSPCADFEANFLYLFVGSRRALLVDTGAVADGERMPLAKTVLGLVPGRGGARLPLLVVHTHGHLDHRAGDLQFQGIPGVQVVGATLDAVREFFGFARWPDGTARLDLGERVVDVLPAPGHHPAHVVFYDERTALVLSGDFLMPGRLLVDDLSAYRASAIRVRDFLRDRAVSHVLGGHIELDEGGAPFAFGSRHHPHERPLELSRDELEALPGALDRFNGFYARHPHFIVVDALHILLAIGTAVALLLALGGWGLVRYRRRRRRRSAVLAKSTS